MRPYGVSLLVAGWDINRGPTLYQVDPSGSFWAWKASAIGKNMVNAKTFLEKRYSEELELEDAIHIALLTLKDNIEGEMNGDTIEIGEFVSSFSHITHFPARTLTYDNQGIVGAPAEHLLGLEGVEGAVGPRFRKLTPQEIEDYLTSL